MQALPGQPQRKTAKAGSAKQAAAGKRKATRKKAPTGAKKTTRKKAVAKKPASSKKPASKKRVAKTAAKKAASKATKKGKQRVTITPVDVGEKKEYLIPRGKHINVYEGDYIRAGEPLIGGAANPQDILKIKGEVALAIEVFEPFHVEIAKAP